MPDSQPADTPNVTAFARSPESQAFEQMWRALPRQGLVPARDAFKPNQAKRFLRNLILIAVPSDAAGALTIRLVGSGLHEQIGKDVTGLDYVHFLGEERRETALVVARKMFEQPCGFWQIAPVHYERGFSQYWEMTALPLAGSAANPPTVIAYVRPAERLLHAERTGERAMFVGLTTQFEYLDVGAGVPELG